MAAVNGSVKKKPHASANHRRDHLPTSSGIRKQAQEVTKDIQELGIAAKDAAQEKLGQLRKIATEHCEQERDKVLHAKRTVGQFILGLPIKSVLTALGVGVLLGTFWTIRRR